ncbi:tRNA(m5U54)methyltransferase [Dinochytrium kinnereticum]|nr:tRNA(m5U54)methyltransferase [Dinochytrium kinnereticum]
MQEITEPLTVLGVSPSGYGLCVGKGGWLVLIPIVLEGEVVIGRVYMSWIGVSFADLVTVERASERRIEPRCKYFRDCSGCSFQHISYEDQLKRKKRMVETAFARVKAVVGGPVDDESLPTLSSLVEDIHPSPLPFEYRTKITPHYPSMRANTPFQGMGFLERGRLRKVVNIEECLITTDAVNQKLKQVQGKALAQVFPFDRKASTTMLRNTLVHEGRLSLNQEPREPLNRRYRPPKTESSGMRLLHFVEGLKGEALKRKDDDVQGKTPETLASRLGLDPTLPWPQEWPPKGFRMAATTDPKQIVTEVVNGQIFRGPANVFFQLNSSILGHLTHYVRTQLQEHALTRGVTTLVDAYCGSGLFSLQCSFDFKKVIGLEVDKTAIRWARYNAQDNGVKNVSFEGGLVSSIFTSVQQNENPDQVAVVIDPSQKGCGPEFLQMLMRFNPKVIIYVSCDVMSQAADLLLMDVYAREGVKPPAISPEATEKVRGLSMDAPRKIGASESKPNVFYLGGKRIEVGSDGKVQSKQDVGIDVRKDDGSVEKHVRLKVQGYKVVTVKPFDLFPQTGRIENVITLIRED